MFRRIELAADEIRFAYEGREIVARPGDSVATALLLSGERSLRTTAISGSSRAPFCMMGVCFECLMEIDGVGNRQACLTPVAAGMQVRRQLGPRGVR
jgi:sarcosine oxidase subunit alpha